MDNQPQPTSPIPSPPVLNPDPNPAVPPPIAAQPGSTAPQPVNPTPMPLNEAPMSPPVPTSSPQPIVAYSQNVPHDPIKQEGKPTWLVVSLITAPLVFVAVLVYFLILPLLFSHNYTSGIPQYYDGQSSSMAAVYKSLGRPLFTSTTASYAQQQKDFTYITGVIGAAVDSTQTLHTHDHATVLVGTTWLHNVSKTNNEYQAMQQYVADSEDTLDEYQTLINYYQGLSKIGQTQIPKVVSDFILLSNAGNSVPTYLADTQTTTTDLQTLINQVKALKPSTDTQGFNQSLLTNLTALNLAMQNVASALQGNREIDIINSIGALSTSVGNFQTLISTNITTSIPTSSILHNKIVNVQSEKPLQ